MYLTIYITTIGSILLMICSFVYMNIYITTIGSIIMIIIYYLFLVRLIELSVILPDATTVKVKVPVNDTVENVKKHIEVSSAL